MHQEIIERFNSLKEKQLSIDITRGKPDKDQLDLSNELIDMTIPFISEDGADLRNYGEQFGIIEARRLGSELLSAPIENIKCIRRNLKKRWEFCWYIMRS